MIARAAPLFLLGVGGICAAFFVGDSRSGLRGTFSSDVQPPSRAAFGGVEPAALLESAARRVRETGIESDPPTDARPAAAARPPSDEEAIALLFEPDSGSPFSVFGRERVRSLPDRDYFATQFRFRFDRVEQKSARYVAERLPDGFRSRFPLESEWIDEVASLEPDRRLGELAPPLTNEALQAAFTPTVREKFFELEGLGIYPTVVGEFRFHELSGIGGDGPRQDILTYMEPYRTMLERDVPVTDEFWSTVERYGQETVAELAGLTASKSFCSRDLLARIGEPIHRQSIEVVREIGRLVEEECDLSTTRFPRPAAFWFEVQLALAPVMHSESFSDTAITATALIGDG